MINFDIMSYNCTTGRCDVVSRPARVAITSNSSGKLEPSSDICSATRDAFQTPDDSLDISVAELQTFDRDTSPTSLDLSVRVIRIWAKLLRKEGIWPVVITIGKALALYGDLLMDNVGIYRNLVVNPRR
jgi:hypothetical protein